MLKELFDKAIKDQVNLHDMNVQLRADVNYMIDQGNSPQRNEKRSNLGQMLIDPQL